jgi:hypothetical protein
LNPFELNRLQHGAPVLLGGTTKEVRPILDQPFLHMNEKVQKVAALFPREVNDRMMVQVSRFTIHGFEQPMECFPDSNKFLLKFEIAPTSKLRLLSALGDMGIRSSNLFPDLDHLAKDVL